LARDHKLLARCDKLHAAARCERLKRMKPRQPGTGCRGFVGQVPILEGVQETDPMVTSWDHVTLHRPTRDARPLCAEFAMKFACKNVFAHLWPQTSSKWPVSTIGRPNVQRPAPSPLRGEVWVRGVG
jgi:hypothetical protein